MSKSNGEIYNRRRAKQLVNFKNMSFVGSEGMSRITPTDLDLLIEYHNKLFVITELKYMEAKIGRGQRLALVRLAEACNRPFLFILATHDVHQPENDIDASRAIVQKVHFKLAGSHPLKPSDKYNGLTVREVVDRFIERVESLAAHSSLTVNRSAIPTGIPSAAK